MPEYIIPDVVLLYVKKYILPLKIEVCGYILFSYNREAMIGEVARGDSKMERASCVRPYKANYAWHSHFLNAKSYPSAEDILSVMKKRETQKTQNIVEIIFTRWGIWEISSSEKTVFRNVNAELQYISGKGDDIYRACKGGKTDFYDMGAIKTFISKVENHYNIIGLRIWFTPWGNDKYVFNTDIKT